MSCDQSKEEALRLLTEKWFAQNIDAITKQNSQLNTAELVRWAFAEGRKSYRMLKTFDRACLECGEIGEVKAWQTYQRGGTLRGRFCSPSCSSKFNHRTQELTRKRPPTNCAWCKIEIPYRPKKWVRKYCSYECLAKARLATAANNKFCKGCGNVKPYDKETRSHRNAYCGTDCWKRITTKPICETVVQNPI